MYEVGVQPMWVMIVTPAGDIVVAVGAHHPLTSGLG
jgi:hypothetical protein